MQLYSDNSQYSHQVRFVLAIKSVSVSIVPINQADMKSGMHTHFAENNPRQSLPTLVDREVILTHPIVMLEYLEERFPYPGLLPPLPAARADVKERLYHLNLQTCKYADIILQSRASARVEKVRALLNDEISALLLGFADQEWCLSPSFSLLDCCIAPLLWRLPVLGIQLPQTKRTKPLFDYMHKIFKRDDFLGSMTHEERDMR